MTPPPTLEPCEKCGGTNLSEDVALTFPPKVTLTCNSCGTVWSRVDQYEVDIGW
jgi:uncharacterized Zn finger protein